jgi:TPR repeat protein
MRFCKKSTWALCCALFFVPAAMAGTAGQCKKLVQAKQYRKAFPVCRKAAGRGIADAEYNLGVLYAHGQGVPQNYAKAAYWTRKAAVQGSKANLRRALADQRAGKEQANSPLKLFGVGLKGITRDQLEPVLTKAGLTPHNGHVGAKWWFDKYDVNGRLEGASELAVGYTSDNRFAFAEYTFPSIMIPDQVRRIIAMVKTKYGRPSSVNGPYGLGNVTAYWNVGDGMRVEVKRGWPNTTTYLDLIDVKAYAAMKQAMAKQKAKRGAKRAKKQSNAF